MLLFRNCYLEALILLFFRWGVDMCGAKTKAKWAQMCLCDHVPDHVLQHANLYQV